MSPEALVTMLLGMLAVWGGLVASLAVTLRRSRRRGPDGRSRPGSD